MLQTQAEAAVPAEAEVQTGAEVQTEAEIQTEVEVPTVVEVEVGRVRMLVRRGSHAEQVGDRRSLLTEKFAFC